MALFKKRKKQTPKQAKNLARIRRLITRAESRGYRFPDELKAELPNYSTQKLKSLTADKLYGMATAIDMETGEILSGTEARKKERSISAKLGALTRKARQKAGEVVQGIKQRVAGDATAGSPVGALSPESAAGQVGQAPRGADIILGYLDDFIAFLDEPTSQMGTSQMGRSYRRSSRVAGAIDMGKSNLRALVNDVIARDGRDALAWRLQANADRASDCIDAFRYSSDASRIQSAATELASIINGGSLTLEQALAIGEQSEYNESWEEPE